MVRSTVLGALALAIGLLVYLTGRDAAHAQWIPAVPALAGTLSFGTAGAWLPSLVHVLGFGLLTAALVPASVRTATCAAWCAVDRAFELGQHSQMAPLLSGWLLQLPVSVPGADALGRYFSRGTFDPRDLLACVAGAVLAAAILRLDRPRFRGMGHAC
jgi:hypothetical protein